jgi:hypothetical protein
MGDRGGTTMEVIAGALIHGIRRCIENGDRTEALGLLDALESRVEELYPDPPEPTPHPRFLGEPG